MEYISIEEIYKAYYACRKNKRSKKSQLEFELHYESYLKQLYEELNSQTYQIGKSIVFGVTRPKHREVFAADFRDRIVHHLLMIKLEPILESEMISTSYNCRKGKGTDFGVKTLQNQIQLVSKNYKVKTYVLQCDIQGFFMSINKDILWSKIKHIMELKWTYGNLEWWLWLIKLIIYNRPELNCQVKGDRSILDNLPNNKTLFRSNGKGLPIGNLTSQIFGNYYLTGFDNWIVSQLKNESYGRYVDDFYIVGNSKRRLLKFIPKIRKYLVENLDVTLHPRKVMITDVKKGIFYIGTVIKPWGMYVGNRTVSNAFKAASESKVRDMNRHVQRLNSYFGFMVYKLSYGIRWRLWKEIYKNCKEKICCINMKKVKLYGVNCRNTKK